MPDKVVIITGASSGIGAAVALRAARKGYRVVLFARREEKLKALASKIAATGGAALVVVGDATSLEDQQRLVDQTVAKYGRIDILMNNAGLPPPPMGNQRCGDSDTDADRAAAFAGIKRYGDQYWLADQPHGCAEHGQLFAH